MANPFKVNPHKAATKMEANHDLIAVCLTVFGIMWALTPEKLSLAILLQFIFAIPLLYISSISYAKIAYQQDAKFWDYLGWFTGTMATAFALNIIGILTFLLGHAVLSLIYFFITWLLLLVYTLINIYYNPEDKGTKIFKFLFFIVVQLIFGVLILFI